MKKLEEIGSTRGLVFDVQGYAVHDGAGCRTLVFLSGCPLRCRWCSNPEGQIARRRVMYRETRCVHQQYRCVPACPAGGVRLDEKAPPYLRFDRAVCDRCESLSCADACLSDALRVAGAYYTPEDLMRILRRDQSYWGAGGGVTFGGGEPLMRSEFILEVLRRCRSEYMHTVVETSACVDQGVLLEALQCIDWLFVDIKHMDTARHRDGTGVDNELILDNIAAIARSGWGGRLIIRVTLVPGYNDSEDALRVVAGFMKEHGLGEINLLPFHRLGAPKYQQLSLDYAYAECEPPSRDRLLACAAVFERAGLRCYIDSGTPF